MLQKPAAAPKKKKKKSTVDPAVGELVSYLYSEATGHITSNSAVKITADGLKTPLGVLTIGQLELGEECLAEIHKEMEGKAVRPAIRACPIGVVTSLVSTAHELLEGLFVSILLHHSPTSWAGPWRGELENYQQHGWLCRSEHLLPHL